MENPNHYIAFNNPNEVLNLLITKYGVVVPENEEVTMDELIATVDVAYEIYGNQFTEDMMALHPDKDAILQQEIDNSALTEPEKNRLQTLSRPQLNVELDALNGQLVNIASLDLSQRNNIIEKINFINQLKKQKPESVNINVDFHKIQKQNQLLLIALTAVALMFLGSKIFKNN